MTPYRRHPQFQEFATHLAAQTPVGKLPGRQHVDPIETPQLLPDLSLVDAGRQRTPRHWSSVLAVPGREHIRLKRIVVPLASDGETFDMLIGVHAFADP